jgi:hypothetical protein
MTGLTLMWRNGGEPQQSYVEHTKYKEVHHRFPTIALKTPSRVILANPLDLWEGVFNNPLENPALCMKTQTDQNEPWENVTCLSITTGFPHYHKACYCCFFKERRRRRT